MIKYILFYLLFVLISPVKAQPYYTPLRAGFSLEVLGIAPVTMFSAELPVIYLPRGFWNLQAGIGLTGKSSSYYAPSFSTSFTHNFLLNPYHKNLCYPAPGYNRLESYLETGIAVSIFEAQYTFLPQELNSKSHFRPAGILGIRFHLIKDRWFYILKFRLTPFLDRKFKVWGGAGIGLGWK